MRVIAETLDSGLRVLLSPNPEEPRVACRVVVRAGAAQDPADATGTAHLLEHLLANKGTERLGVLDREAERPLLQQIDGLFDALNAEPGREDLVRAIDRLSLRAATLAVPNELKQAYGRLGARSLNAYTSHDRTAYVVDLPPEALPAWAALERDRFRSPVFRGFQTEVETVREEKRRGLDDPARASRESLAAALWGEHPYGRPILGEIAHLDAPRPRALRSWFERWYVPANMAVVLAGDFAPEATLELVRRAFDREGPAPPEPGSAPPPPPLRGEQRRTLTHHGAPSVSVGWRTVPRGHPDEAALAVADMLLCNGATGLLDELEHEQALRRAWSSPSFRRLGGTLVVGGQPSEGQSTEEVEGLLLDAVERLRQGRVDPKRLRAIIQAWRVRELRGLEQNAWRASQMMDSFTFDEPWERIRGRTDERARVSLEEAVHAARRWLGPDRVVVTRESGEPVLPGMKARSLSPRPTQEGLNSAFFTEVQAMKSRARGHPSLREGRDYVVRGSWISAPNPYSELASLAVRVPYGQGHDPSLGVAVAWLGQCGRGQGTLADWEGWLYEHAGNAAVQVGRWSARLAVSGPRAQVPTLLEGLLDRIGRPSWTEAGYRRWIADLLLRREQSRTNKATLEGALRAFALYGDRSPWLAEPNEQALLAATPTDLLARVQSLLACRADLLAVGLEQPLTWAGDREPPAPEPRRFERPGADRVLLLEHEGAQAQVSVELPLDRYDPAEVPLYKVLAELLGGGAGLVFQTIREARGLAYSAHAQLDRGSLPGDDNRLAARIGTRPDQVVQAASLAAQLLREPPLDRFEQARTVAVSKLRAEHTSFRSVPSSVLSWRLRGLDGDPRPGWLARLEALPRDQFEAWVRSWSDRPLTVTVVGTGSTEASLAGLGTVSALDFSDISTR